MAEILFVKPLEIKKYTIIDGNVDDDKIQYAILNVMVREIEPLLGSELYDKLKEDKENGTLTGLYSTLFTQYVQPITLHKATAEFIEISNYLVRNGGTYKHQAENAEIVDKDELYTLSGKYNSNAQVYIDRFYKWICKNPLPEYKTLQDEVNAQRDVKVTAGWYFGSDSTKSVEYISTGGSTDDGNYFELENGDGFIELED